MVLTESTFLLPSTSSYPYPIHSPCSCRSTGGSAREAPGRRQQDQGGPSWPSGAGQGPSGCGGSSEWLPEPLPLRAPGQGSGAGCQVSSRLDPRQHSPHVGLCLPARALPLLLCVPLSPPSSFSLSSIAVSFYLPCHPLLFCLPGSPASASFSLLISPSVLPPIPSSASPVSVSLAFFTSSPSLCHSSLFLPFAPQVTPNQTPQFCSHQLCLCQHPQVQPGPGPRRPHCV